MTLFSSLFFSSFIRFERELLLRVFLCGFVGSLVVCGRRNGCTKAVRCKGGKCIALRKEIVPDFLFVFFLR